MTLDPSLGDGTDRTGSTDSPLWLAMTIVGHFIRHYILCLKLAGLNDNPVIAL